MTALAELHAYSVRIRGLLRDLRAQLAGERCPWRALSEDAWQDWVNLRAELHRQISANFWLRQEIERRQQEEAADAR